jgi:hypothetical protein
MRSALFWDVTLRLVVIPDGRFGQPSGPIFKGQEIQGCPETSVSNDHQALRNIPEERRSHVLRGGNLKQRTLEHMFTKLPATLLQ